MNVLYVHDICKLREKEKETQKVAQFVSLLAYVKKKTPVVFFLLLNFFFLKRAFICTFKSITLFI